MMRIHSLSFQIRAMSISLVLAVSAAFLIIFIKNTKEANMENLGLLAEATIKYLNADIQTQLAKSMDLAIYTAANAEGLEKKDKAYAKEYLNKNLKENPAAFELYYGTNASRFAGGFFVAATEWDPYVQSTDWDQVKRPWFISALQNPDKVNITEPYIDASTGNLCISITKNLKDDKNKIIGVAGVDVFLTDFTELVNAHKVTEDGNSFLVDKNGLYITHKNQELVMKRTIFDDLDLEDFPKEKVLSKKASVILGKSNYVASIPVENTEWFLVSTGSLTSLDSSSLVPIITVTCIFVLLAVIVSLIFGARMHGKISNAIETIGIVSKGDLTVRLNATGKDEISQMSVHFNEFIEKLLTMIKNMSDNSKALLGNSQNLSAAASQLASSANDTVSKSESVASTTNNVEANINAMASGAELASSNASEVAGAAELMSSNMNTVAAAIEEMSASIKQIAGNTSDVREVSAEAAGKAADATDVMNKLGSAAKEIGQVTDVIKKIADKTNLLALNATIEAASAGEAGKGFAVVAGEIKELANQSAKSADDIAQRIEGIQNSTGNAVRVISDVSSIIGKINESVDAIANHADQQTKASNEIASNVAQANSGAKRVAEAILEVAKSTNEVSRNAGEAARGAHDVSCNAGSMSTCVKTSAQGAMQLNQNAGNLTKIANELQNTVNMFKV